MLLIVHYNILLQCWLPWYIIIATTASIILFLGTCCAVLEVPGVIYNIYIYAEIHTA